MRTPPSSPGLYGSGLACGPDGRPLRPGGPELTEILLDLARFAPDRLIVDVGCGQGTGIAALLARGLRGVGVDNDHAALERARHRLADGVFLHADAGNLPFASGTVDGIMAECVLSTLADRPAALREWSRVLTAGGRLALSDVYRRAEAPDAADAAADCGSPLMNWRDLATELAEAGFVVEGFEDRSAVLRNWVARFVFEYGSLNALGGCGFDAASIRRAAPGYFVLIADRRIGPSEART